jgi:hypothetical protein
MNRGIKVAFAHGDAVKTVLKSSKSGSSIEVFGFGRSIDACETRAFMNQP